MQRASKEYAVSMNRIGRNRGYIKVTLGVINSEAQANLQLSPKSEITYFSDASVIKGQTVNQVYATCEENFSKVDGSMFFLPQPQAQTFYNNGLVSEEINGAIKFTFATDIAYEVAGFTIDFGDCYPIDFTISSGTSTITVTDNDKRYFMTDEGIHDLKELTISATKMLGGADRLRIYSIQMGVSNTFTNENTMSFTQTNYVSPLADTLPSTDISVTVENYEQHYNPDNENSILSFFEVGQEVKVQFGYDTLDDGNIEWLPETVTHLKTWSATDRDATFTATDIFDYLNGTYYKGRYYEEGISLYDLAVDVFNDAGIERYKIDSSLKKVIVYNPLPPVAHTEALQIIANAGRCTIREDRDGIIYLESTFIPQIEISSSGETEYSNIKNILKDTNKIAYALQSQDFSLIGDDIRFFGEIDLSKVGYVSEQVSNSNGDFSKIEGSYENGVIKLDNAVFDNGLIHIFGSNSNPKITLDLEADYSPYALYIKFRNTYPTLLNITTYLDEVIVESFDVENDTTDCMISHTFSPFNKLEVEIIKGYPNSRVVIDKIGFGAPTDYTIKRQMMFTSPTATRQDKLKEFVVSTFTYSESTSDIKDLITNTITNAQEGGYTYNFSKASYGFEVRVVSGVVDIDIIESSAYAITIGLSNVETTEVKIAIAGYVYDVDEQYYSVKHNENGIVKTWSNPLVSSNDHAQKIEKWLSSYFLGDVEYELDWRGDPRIDANDLFFLELKSGEEVNIRGYQTTLDFDGGWSGTMKARKVLV